MEEMLLSIDNIGKAYDIADRGERKLKTLLENMVQSRLLGMRTEPKSRPFWALRNISFNVQRGETIGVIGKNGSGKSTLLKLIARLIHPTEGSILRNGTVGSYLGIGAGIHPELTGRENIYVNATLLGIPRRSMSKTVDQIVAFAELEDFIDVPVKFYSSGMHARLAFSVAAFQDTGDILLIDEALAAGDIAFCKKCYDHLRGLVAQGKTVVFATHGLGQVQELGSRCLYMQRGNLVMDGTPDDVITRYKTDISLGQQLAANPTPSMAFA